MDVAKTPAIERIARVLAGRELSANADGAKVSASAGVDATWPVHRDQAVSILKTLREPDEAMAAVGDTAVWERMIAAALGNEPPADQSGPATSPLDPGSDPFIEGP
jgi:hypothetical protein